MDKVFIAQIESFLRIKKPTDAQIVDAAMLLLRISPQRYRALYNSAKRRPQGLLAWIQADLKKHLAIRKRGLETSQVEDYNRKVVKKTDETLSMIPEGVLLPEDGAPMIPILGKRGKRIDHDSLPEEIQQLWDHNTDRWLRIRKLRAQLAQMIAKPGYAACDGNELCFQICKLDETLRAAYAKYDAWNPAAEGLVDKVDVYTDNVKTVQNARTAISRGLARKTQNDDSLKKMQDAVNALSALKQDIKPNTVKRLKALGIVVPEEYAEG